MTKLPSIQALYDLCKKTFTPSGLPPPSQAVQKICSLLGLLLQQICRLHCCVAAVWFLVVAAFFAGFVLRFAAIIVRNSVVLCCRKVSTAVIFAAKSLAAISENRLPADSMAQDTIGPTDVGLKQENVEDDRGHGFFGFNQFNRGARWAQPITFLDIHENDNFTMCVFCLPTSSVIPLHDHPGMTVLSKMLYGSMHVKAYDWVEPACIQNISGSSVRLARLVVDEVLTAPCETSSLYPKHGGNLHCFTAVTSCAVLDVLAPPYSEVAGRKCTYYHDYPYSSFLENGSENREREKEEYAWLKEIDTPNIYMHQGKYTGPAIQV